MPLPQVKKGISQKEFVSSCMSDDVMVREFPDQKQRAAVCFRRYKDKRAKASYIVSTANDEFIFDKDEIEKKD